MAPIAIGSDERSSRPPWSPRGRIRLLRTVDPGMSPTASPSPLAGRAPGAPVRPAWRRARGVAIGVVCGLGALVGHQVAGGEVAVMPALLALACAVLGGVWLTRPDRPDALRAVLLAGAGQLVCHGIFLMSPQQGGHDHAGATAAAGGGHAAAMLVSHGLVALVTAGVALGADRALLDLARTLCAWLLPRLPRAVALPCARRGVPIVRTTVPRGATRWGAAPARAPPPASRLRPLSSCETST